VSLPWLYHCVLFLYFLCLVIVLSLSLSLSLPLPLPLSLPLPLPLSLTLTLFFSFVFVFAFAIVFVFVFVSAFVSVFVSVLALCLGFVVFFSCRIWSGLVSLHVQVFGSFNCVFLSATNQKIPRSEFVSMSEEVAQAAVCRRAGAVQQAPCVYISHGGGPLPLLGKQPGVAAVFEELGKQFAVLDVNAFLIISAHWQATPVCVSAGNWPNLLFDYGGFPPETYKYTHPAPGLPALANKVVQLLAGAKIACNPDQTRGWDHGVFVPMKIIDAEATKPIVALSLTHDLDAETQIRMGEALSPLREEGVAILASGGSFHNFDYLFAQGAKRAQGLEGAQVFDQWLQNTLCNSTLSYEERRELLVNWEKAPSARIAHPHGGEEHLLPLMVAFGASKSSEGATAAATCVKVDSQYQSPHDFATSNFHFGSWSL
jgi:4,5-DOPA dioxygenase extradiol